MIIQVEMQGQAILAEEERCLNGATGEAEWSV